MKILFEVLCLCVLLNTCSTQDLVVNNTAVDELSKNDTASSDKNGESPKRGSIGAAITSSGTRDDTLMALLANRRKALMSNRHRATDEITTAAQRLNPIYALPKTPKTNPARSYSRSDIRAMVRNATDSISKRREFRPGNSIRTTKLPEIRNNDSILRTRNDTDDIFEVDESNQGLFVVNPKTLEYVPPNDSVPPNSNEVYVSDSRPRISSLKDQSEEQDYDLASFQYFGQKISTPRSNETRSGFYRSSPPVVRWRANSTKTSREDDSSDMMDIGVARTSVEQNKIRHLKMNAQNRRLALYNNSYRKFGAMRLVPGKGNFTLANDTQSNESIINHTRITPSKLPIREPIRNVQNTESDTFNDQINGTTNIITSENNTASPFTSTSETISYVTTKRSIEENNINIPQNFPKFNQTRPINVPSNYDKNLWKLNEDTAATTEGTTEFLIIIPSVISEDDEDSYQPVFTENSKSYDEIVTIPENTPSTSQNVLDIAPEMRVSKNISTNTTSISNVPIVITSTETLPEIKQNVVNETHIDSKPINGTDENKMNVTVVYRTTSSSNNNTSVAGSKLSSTEKPWKSSTLSSTKDFINNIETTIHPTSTSSTLRIPANITESLSHNNFSTTLSSSLTTRKPTTATKSNSMDFAASVISQSSIPSSWQPEGSATSKSIKNSFIAAVSENRTQNLKYLDKFTTENSDIRSTTAYDAILKNNNEVIMEIHRINFATYVLAGLGLVPVILITVYVVVNLLNRAKKIPEDLEHCAKDSTPITNTAVDDECDLYSVTSEYHFDRSNLRFKSILGEGNFGQVWKAEADDLTGHFGSTRIVAVKAERDEGGPGLRAEAEIMKKLGQHSNVVTLLGLCMEQEPHLLIMEYAMRGRLLSLLRACKGPDGTREERDRTPPIANIQLTGFALDIAKGMEYIAARKIVHRDLAARNVLIDHNGVCKICDFGMSLDLGTAKVISLPSGADSARRKRRRPLRKLKLPDTRSGGNAGGNGKQRPAMPIRWMAPESLQMHLYSTETDVWAFGVLLWEIFTLGCTPYPNLSGREVVRLVPSGLRLESPRRCCGTLLNLMSRCWKSDSAQRPSFAEARHDLVALHRAESAAMDAMDDASTTDCFDVSGFSEDYENGVVYFDRRISEFECDI